ncbi:MAG: NAD(P)-dependent oxidoreductase [Thermoleophilia bacterium]|nr:NAD(P)-dependent oxidoreductase [Thermoleophilia bacterium]
MTDWTFAEDLEAIMTHAERDLVALRGADILITGGTGFVGTWLVSALCHADQRLHLGIRTTILTRDPVGFADRSPQLAAWAAVIRGDVTAIPLLPPFDVAIHAATPASAALNDDNPDLMRSTIVEGMRSLLAALEPSGSIPLLFTSSGAIYGPQPVGLEHTPEEFEPAPDAIEARNAYALGKRDAEAIALAASRAGGPSLRLARLFAFVGPHLPLDAHFAIGNFVRDAIAGGPICVAGDGSAVRSYLYAGDMIEQLLAILMRGLPDRAYNVGSDEAITIRELAQLVGRELAPDAHVEIAGLAQGALPTGAGSRYVPATTRIADELGCRAHVNLPEAIRRTAASHSA